VAGRSGHRFVRRHRTWTYRDVFELDPARSSPHRCGGRAASSCAASTGRAFRRRASAGVRRCPPARPRVPRVGSCPSR
jgi:hypothetical protein